MFKTFIFHEFFGVQGLSLLTRLAKKKKTPVDPTEKGCSPQILWTRTSSFEHGIKKRFFMEETVIQDRIIGPFKTGYCFWTLLTLAILEGP